MSSYAENKSILTVDFQSWNEFKTSLFKHLFEEEPVIRGQFLFRGHRKSTWALAPSFDRSFPDAKARSRDDIEKRLIELFKEESETDDNLRDLLSDETAIIALAQHSGLPTRLLDWSDSPYVAAFFAFNRAISAHAYYESEETAGDLVAIWALDSNSYIWKGGRGVEIVSPSAWKNARLRNQFGKFTLSKTPFRNLQEYVNFFDDAVGALWKFTIPATEAREALTDLDLMGLNNSTLFPDLDGRAKAAIIKVLLEEK